MIQNILTFCVKNDLTYVSGSIPSGKLVANDINRNSIYLITPYDEAIVKANFQTNLQSDTPTSVLGILVNGEIEVSELVDTNASYYNLVKDWNIYEFKVPSTTLSFISRNRTGKIGINFSIEQRLVPMIKVSYGTYKGEITELAQTPTEDGYYIIKALGYEYEDSVELKSFDINDILVYNATTDVATKISAYSNRGSTPTAMYSVDPSLLNDNFETIDSGLTAQIVQQVNDNTSDILLLNQGVLNDGVAITDLQNRMSVAESDIDTAENNIVNLQGRMTTAESDIDKIENGTTIVEKALRDSLGNIIKDSYVSSVYPVYNSTTDKLFIETYDVQDSLLANNEVILPKATTTKNGLMAKEDKVKVDNIASNISSAITTHDNSATAHLPLRTLINDLQKEIDRLNAKGRSWGEIDLTFSQWFALTEPTRSNYINTFLATNFSGYTPSNGDLVYTIVSDTEEEHELEYNSALSQWVDNGAYIVGKASNTQMGLVQGDLTYVSILNGLIQVLKSDYATNVGSSGASYDYDDLLALFTEVANDIYKKTETYSNTEIEQRITDLLGLANLQDTEIQKSAGVFVFDNGDSVLASSLAQYNWVITRFYNVDGGVQNVRYNMFKPSEATSGNRTIIQIDRTPVRYAEIKRDNGNILFRVVDESDTFDNTYVCTMKMWGIKLDGITANEVEYSSGVSVKDKLDAPIELDELSFSYTKNLYNPNITVSNNTYLNYTNGTTGSFAGVDLTDYIKIKPNTTYSFNFNKAVGAIIGHGFYDENKTFISGIKNSMYNQTFTTPATAKYIRLTGDMTISERQLEISDVITQYKPYNVLIDYESVHDNKEVNNVIERNNNSFENNDYLEQTYEYHDWNNTLIDYNTSTFSGFGWSIGNPTSIESVQIQLFTRTTPFTKLNYYITKNDKNGDILRYGNLVFSGLEANKKYDIIIDLLKPIEANTDQLYFVIQADQYMATYKTNIELSGVVGIQTYHTGGTFVNPTSMTNIFDSSKKSLAFRAGFHIKSYSPKPEFLENSLVSFNTVRVILPNEYIAVVGDKLQIFYRGIIEAVNPYNYDIFFKCSKGKAYTRYFEITPLVGDVGEHDIEIVVRDNNGKVLDSKTTKLKIIAKKTNPATTKNLLCIGDSLTASGTYITEFRRRLVESGGTPTADGMTNINFIGTQGTSPNLHEGRSGWTWADFINTSSPFYNSSTSQLDFANYCSVNGFSGIDYVVLLLSWNGFLPNKPLAGDHLVFVNYAKTLINKLKEQYPNVKVVLNGIQLPSLNGGMGYVYGANGGYSETYGNVRSVFGLNLAYKDFANEGTYSPFMKHYNLSGQFDSENNMPTIDVAVNSRSLITEKRGSNGVHPKDDGYLQIADAVYRALHDII